MDLAPSQGQEKELLRCLDAGLLYAETCPPREPIILCATNYVTEGTTYDDLKNRPAAQSR